MSSEESKALISRWYDELWVGRNPDAIDALYAPTWVGHFAGAELPDPAMHKRVAAMFNAGFPDAQYAVEHLFAEEDRVGSLVTIRATHLGEWRGLAPTGRAIVWANMNIHRVASGRIAEQWRQYDVLSLLNQLGASPQP
jgi:hypothetical protein